MGMGTRILRDKVEGAADLPARKPSIVNIHISINFNINIGVGIDISAVIIESSANVASASLCVEKLAGKPRRA